MSHVFQNILPHAARVRFIDGGARKSDPDDCDDDDLQCFFFFLLQPLSESKHMECLYEVLLRKIPIRSPYFESKCEALSCTFPRWCILAKCNEAPTGAEG